MRLRWVIPGTVLVTLLAIGFALFVWAQVAHVTVSVGNSPASSTTAQRHLKAPRPPAQSAPTTTSLTAAPNPTTTSTAVSAVTVPPTTTTIAQGTVPNAVEASVGGLASGEEAIRESGFVPNVVRVLEPACEFGFAGQLQWNTNLVLSQTPPAGSVAPLGITVTLDAC